MQTMNTMNIPIVVYSISTDTLEKVFEMSST